MTPRRAERPAPSGHGPGSDDLGAPLHGRRRALRVAALGGSSMALACAAHRLGGGVLPPWWLLAALTAFVGTAAVVLTARRLRLPLLVVVLLVQQAGLHLVFSLAAGSECVPAVGHGAAGGASTAGMPGMPGMPGALTATGACLAPQLHASGIGSAGVWTASGTGAGATGSMLAAMAPMLLAHLVATLVTAWLLARGERLLWRVAERVADVVVDRIVAAAGRLGRRRPRPVRPAVPLRLRAAGTAALVRVGGRAPPHVLLATG
ncbi:hypothetical protein FHX74_000937 [Friedmanniella endophytica]|uniref:Integral membrane protein n=1 Tax=Microlunatus kandeliicorticis TaxID=1759536 RepID=A0A7W3IQF8_9ACTN|nr:hypothetical protein [Microlunatus kandeliicorticis]MBA8793343.1 hypothetical protein [Microlunatus kandeliicorticis]